MIADTQTFIDRLNVAKPGLAKKEIVEDTGSYMFDNGNMYSFNDSVAVSCWAPVNNINGAVNATWLHKIINNSHDPFVDVRCADSMLHISGKETSAKIPVNHESCIPSYIHGLDIPSTDSRNWSNLDSKFNRFLKTCLSTVSTNYARPILTCLHWNNDILETSDNYAITRCTLASTHQGARCILIPRESASVLLKFDPTAFTWTGDWLHFKTKQNAVVSCRTFEGVFPDLSRCLSLEPKKFIEFPPNFLTILKRVSKITPKNDFLQKDAKISIGKGVLTICVRVGDGGQFQESCPVDFKGTLTFNVDLIRLEQILKEHGNHVAGFVEFKGTSGLLKFETDNVVQQVLVSSVSHVS